MGSAPVIAETSHGVFALDPWLSRSDHWVSAERDTAACEVTSACGGISFWLGAGLCPILLFSDPIRQEQ